jgi:alpha-beta hydrolase superfamily lysophospholipase
MNHEAATLQPLRSELIRLELAACQLRLSGHTRNSEDNYRVSAELWAAEVNEAVRKFESQYPELPRIGLGYSIGAALLLQQAITHPETGFSKFVLLAPALALGSKSILLEFLTPFRIFDLSLPSAAPKEYRVSDSTPLAMYRAALDTVSTLDDLEAHSILSNIPALIFVSKNDEVVDYEGIHDWIKDRNLDKWQIETLHPNPTLPSSFNHLIIDQQTLGDEEWQRLLKAIEAFLSPSKS